MNKTEVHNERFCQMVIGVLLVAVPAIFMQFVAWFG
ncbi:hypothetical protein BAIN110137_18795 [Bacillus inaquosorum]